MKEHQKMPGVIRDDSPCKGCTERFIACSDKCPKDLRGEYGYKAWTGKIQEVKANRTAYYKQRKELSNWDFDC